jgi:hypothetical protein
MESLIKATLGLDTTDFQTKAKDAEKQLKGFAEGVQNISKVFTAGGTITAVVGFFNSVVESARSSKNEMDSNVQAVRRFGDSMDQAKVMGADLAISVVGSLNRIGESIGETARGMFEFARGIEKQLSELRVKAMTIEEQMSYQLNLQNEAAEKLKQSGLSLVEIKRAELAEAKAGAAYETARATLAKQNDEDAKKKIEALKKSIADLAEKEKDRAKTSKLIADYALEEEGARRRTFRLETQIELAYRDLVQTKRALTSFSGEESEKQRLITLQHDQQKTLLELTADLESKRGAAAAETLAKQAGITSEMKKQDASREAAKGGGGYQFTAPDYLRASEAEIKDWRDQMKKQAEQQMAESMQPAGSAMGYRSTYAQAQAGAYGYGSAGAQAVEAQRQLDLRSTFQRSVKIGMSDSQLASSYGGYKNVEELKRTIGTQTDTLNISRTLQNIDSRLNQAGFKQ